MKTLAILAVAAAASVGVANAQTAFDGGYFGFGLGYGHGTVSDFDGTGSLSLNGAVGSAFIGWNGSNGNLVYGVEADISFGGIQGDAACINPSWTCDADVSTLGSVRGRLGYAQNNTLFYATAGAAMGRVELTTINAVGTEFPDKKTSTGWVAGVGIEGKVGTSPWHYRAEYLYHDLGRTTYNTDVPYNSATTVGVARFGLVMQF